MSSLLSDSDKTSEADEVERELELDQTVGMLKGKASPEERATFFSRLTFAWLNPLLELGVQRPLQEKDLYNLARQDTSKALGDSLESNWQGLVRSFKYVKLKNTHTLHRHLSFFPFINLSPYFGPVRRCCVRLCTPLVRPSLSLVLSS